MRLSWAYNVVSCGRSQKRSTLHCKALCCRSKTSKLSRCSSWPDRKSSSWLCCRAKCLGHEHACPCKQNTNPFSWNASPMKCASNEMVQSSTVPFNQKTIGAGSLTIRALLAKHLKVPQVAEAAQQVLQPVVLYKKAPQPTDWNSSKADGFRDALNSAGLRSSQAGAPADCGLRARTSTSHSIGKALKFKVSPTSGQAEGLPFCDPSFFDPDSLFSDPVLYSDPLSLLLLIPQNEDAFIRGSCLRAVKAVGSLHVRSHL